MGKFNHSNRLLKCVLKNNLIIEQMCLNCITADKDYLRYKKKYERDSKGLVCMVKMFELNDIK